MAILQGATDIWTKSSYSGGNGACVEVKSPSTAALAFPADAWNAFVTSVKA